MMRDIIRDYSGIEGIQKHEAALADLREWMGGKKFIDMCIKLQEMERPSPAFFRGAMSMLQGVKGYPVKALYIELWGEEHWTD